MKNVFISVVHSARMYTWKGFKVVCNYGIVNIRRKVHINNHQLTQLAVNALNILHAIHWDLCFFCIAHLYEVWEEGLIES